MVLVTTSRATCPSSTDASCRSETRLQCGWLRALVTCSRNGAQKLRWSARVELDHRQAWFDMGVYQEIEKGAVLC